MLETHIISFLLLLRSSEMSCNRKCFVFVSCNSSPICKPVRTLSVYSCSSRSRDVQKGLQSMKSVFYFYHRNRSPVKMCYLLLCARLIEPLDIYGEKWSCCCCIDRHNKIYAQRTRPPTETNHDFRCSFSSVCRKKIGKSRMHKKKL